MPARCTFLLFLSSLTASGATLGVATEWIEKPSTFHQNSTHFFPTASTYKLPIAIAFLHLVQEGRCLNKPDLVERMIIKSDNQASDTILQLAGGPDKVTQFLRAHGIHDLTIATSEKEMSAYRQFLRNKTTPAAMIELLTKLYHGSLLNEPNTAYLLKLMERTTTGPNRIKGLLPPGTVVAHKTGTGDTRDGVTWATNDVGIITLPDHRGHLAIAVYLENSALPTPEARDDVIALEAKKAFDQYSTPRRAR